MKISFERSGGFAGIKMTAVLDTESLPPGDARRLQEMVDASGFLNLPEFFPAPEKGADYFQYKLTVESEGRKHPVEVSEPSVPAKLRPLIDWLTKAARKPKS